LNKPEGECASYGACIEWVGVRRGSNGVFFGLAPAARLLPSVIPRRDGSFTGAFFLSSGLMWPVGWQPCCRSTTRPRWPDIDGFCRAVVMRSKRSVGVEPVGAGRPGGARQCPCARTEPSRCMGRSQRGQHGGEDFGTSDSVAPSCTGMPECNCTRNRLALAAG